MESSKIQSSALFCYSKIDFRDKFEEVSEKFKTFKYFHTKKIAQPYLYIYAHKCGKLFLKDFQFNPALHHFSDMSEHFRAFTVVFTAQIQRKLMSSSHL